MSAILRLYPRAWRERYGDEMLALLEGQPATLGDRLDLIRGALDARLQPQVPGAAVTPEKEATMHQRILGAMAAIGGIVWIVGIASTYVLPLDMYGERDTSLAVWGAAVGGSLIGISLGQLSTRPGSRSWTGHAISIASVALSLTLLFGWPLMILGFVGIPIVFMLGAARAYQTERLPAWAVAVLGIASVAALIGVFGFSGGPAYAAIGLVGLVQAFVALRPAAMAAAGPTQEPT